MPIVWLGVGTKTHWLVSVVELDYGGYGARSKPKCLLFWKKKKKWLKNKIWNWKFSSWAKKILKINIFVGKGSFQFKYNFDLILMLFWITYSFKMFTSISFHNWGLIFFSCRFYVFRFKPYYLIIIYFSLSLSDPIFFKFQSSGP